jgi:serine/threonine protein kinase
MLQNQQKTRITQLSSQHRKPLSQAAVASLIRGVEENGSDPCKTSECVQIGKGSFGKVVAWGKWAIKVSSHQNGSISGLKEMANQLRAGQASQPGLVQLEAFATNAKTSLLMYRRWPITLHDWIYAKTTTLSKLDTSREWILFQLGQSLMDLHAVGLLHNDLKFNNVMVDPTVLANWPKLATRAQPGVGLIDLGLSASHPRWAALKAARHPVSELRSIFYPSTDPVVPEDTPPTLSCSNDQSAADSGDNGSIVSIGSSNGAFVCGSASSESDSLSASNSGNGRLPDDSTEDSEEKEEKEEEEMLSSEARLLSKLKFIKEQARAQRYLAYQGQYTVEDTQEKEAEEIAGASQVSEVTSSFSSNLDRGDQASLGTESFRSLRGGIQGLSLPAGPAMNKSSSQGGVKHELSGKSSSKKRKRDDGPILPQGINQKTSEAEHPHSNPNLLLRKKQKANLIAEKVVVSKYQLRDVKEWLCASSQWRPHLTAKYVSLDLLVPSRKSQDTHTMSPKHEIWAFGICMLSMAVAKRKCLAKTLLLKKRPKPTTVAEVEASRLQQYKDLMSIIGDPIWVKQRNLPAEYAITQRGIGWTKALPKKIHSSLVNVLKAILSCHPTVTCMQEVLAMPYFARAAAAAVSVVTEQAIALSPPLVELETLTRPPSSDSLAWWNVMAATSGAQNHPGQWIRAPTAEGSKTDALMEWTRQTSAERGKSRSIFRRTTADSIPFVHRLAGTGSHTPTLPLFAKRAQRNKRGHKRQREPPFSSPASHPPSTSPSFPPMCISADVIRVCRQSAKASGQQRSSFITMSPAQRFVVAQQMLWLCHGLRDVTLVSCLMSLDALAHHTTKYPRCSRDKKYVSLDYRGTKGLEDLGFTWILPAPPPSRSVAEAFVDIPLKLWEQAVACLCAAATIHEYRIHPQFCAIVRAHMASFGVYLTESVVVNRQCFAVHQSLDVLAMDNLSVMSNKSFGFERDRHRRMDVTRAVLARLDVRLDTTVSELGKWEMRVNLGRGLMRMQDLSLW